MKKVLILGGGVAGCACNYFLQKHGYDVTIIEKNKTVGGLSRTLLYGGHMYDFGPHLYFWGGGLDDPINKTIHDITKGEYYHVSRHLRSYIERDKKFYKYPVHSSDIPSMPDKDKINEELQLSREAGYLIPDRLPVLGECNFEEYFTAAIGPTLYEKFMKDYTEKMWGISGEKLQTKMIWADRLKDDYNKTPYDPIKHQDDEPLADGTFCIYPKEGWTKVWERMSDGATIVNDSVTWLHPFHEVLFLESGEIIDLRKCDIIINTLSLDELFGGRVKLPYMGRMIIPLILPVDKVFPDMVESFHYSGAEPVTRCTEMKVITRQDIDGTLLIIEVPVAPYMSNYLPQNVKKFMKDRNLYEDKCYPEQSKQAFALLEEYKHIENSVDNLYSVGRLAEFRYMGMAETIKSAYDLVEDLNRI